MSRKKPDPAPDPADQPKVRRAKPKKAKADAWTPEAIGDYFTAQSRALALKGGLPITVDGKKTALTVHDARQEAAADVGLRLPHLSLRYLFQRIAFPLERTTILYGPTGSHKSSLLYWFYRLFTLGDVRGRYFHLEVESKDTPVLRLSMTDYLGDVIGQGRACGSMDDFQISFQTYLDWLKGRCAAAGGPGRRLPLVIGIDSLTAKLTADAGEKMRKVHKGAATRRFSDEARSLADWFREAPDQLVGWPFSLVVINHDKPKPAERPGMPEQHHTPGGAAPNYNATYKILARKCGAIPQSLDGWRGNRVRLLMDKSSLATTGLSVEVEFVWKTIVVHAAGGRQTTRQLSHWNWDKATVELLHALQFNKKHRADGQAVAEVLDIGKDGGRYTCAGLGMSEGVPAAELARMLEARPDVLAELEPRIGIQPSLLYDQAVDFQDQLARARAMVDDFLPVPGPVDAAAPGAVGADDDEDDPAAADVPSSADPDAPAGPDADVRHTTPEEYAARGA